MFGLLRDLQQQSHLFDAVFRLQQILGEGRPDLIPIFLNALPAVMAEAIDISNAVLFLVSDESRYVTGLEFKVDAGVTLR